MPAKDIFTYLAMEFTSPGNLEWFIRQLIPLSTYSPGNVIFYLPGNADLARSKGGGPGGCQARLVLEDRVHHRNHLSGNYEHGIWI